MIAKIVNLLKFKRERLHLPDYLLMGAVSVSWLLPAKTKRQRIWRP